MERLTEKIDEHYIARQDRLNGKIIGNQMCLDKLGEYENLEDQDLLLKLPCKIGDTIWYTNHNYSDCPIEAKITEVKIKENSILYTAEKENHKALGFYTDHIGKTIFFTKEEAEQKLKETNNDVTE